MNPLGEENYENLLYPSGSSDDSTVMAADMIAFVTQTGDGLLIHQGPTINSPVDRAANTPSGMSRLRDSLKIKQREPNA